MSKWLANSLLFSWHFLCATKSWSELADRLEGKIPRALRRWSILILFLPFSFLISGTCLLSFPRLFLPICLPLLMARGHLIAHFLNLWWINWLLHWQLLPVSHLSYLYRWSSGLDICWVQYHRPLPLTPLWFPPIANFGCAGFLTICQFFQAPLFCKLV